MAKVEIVVTAETSGAQRDVNELGRAFRDAFDRIRAGDPALASATVRVQQWGAAATRASGEGTRAFKRLADEGVGALIGQVPVLDRAMDGLLDRLRGFPLVIAGVVGAGVAIIAWLRNLQNEANATLTALTNLSTRIVANAEATRAAIQRIDAEMAQNRIAAADATMREILLRAQQERDERIRNAAKVRDEELSAFIMPLDKIRAIWGKFRAEQGAAESDFNDKRLRAQKEFQKDWVETARAADAQIREITRAQADAAREAERIVAESQGNQARAIELRHQQEFALIKRGLEDRARAAREAGLAGQDLERARQAAVEEANDRILAADARLAAERQRLAREMADAQRSVAGELADARAERLAAELEIAGRIDESEQVLAEANIARFRRQAEEYATQMRRRYGETQEVNRLIERNEAATAERIAKVQAELDAKRRSSSSFAAMGRELDFLGLEHMRGRSGDQFTIAEVDRQTALARERNRAYGAGGGDTSIFSRTTGPGEPMAGGGMGSFTPITLPDLAMVLRALAQGGIGIQPSDFLPTGFPGRVPAGPQIQVGWGPTGPIWMDAHERLKQITAEIKSSAEAQRRVAEFTEQLLTVTHSGTGGPGAVRDDSGLARVSEAVRANELLRLQEIERQLVERYEKELAAITLEIEMQQEIIRVAQEAIETAQKAKAAYDRWTGVLLQGAEAFVRLATAAASSADEVFTLAGQLGSVAESAPDVVVAVGMFRAALSAFTGAAGLMAQGRGGTPAALLSAATGLTGQVPGLVGRITGDPTLTLDDQVRLLSELGQGLESAMGEALQAASAFFDQIRDAARAESEARLATLRREQDAHRATLRTLDEWKKVTDEIRERLLGLQTGGLGPTNPMVGFGLAQDEFHRLLAAFRAAPTPEGARNVLQAAELVLQKASEVFTRPSPEYQALFASITQAVADIGAISEQQAKTIDDVVSAITGLDAAIAAEEDALRAKLDQIAAAEAAVQQQLRETFQAALANVRDALNLTLQRVYDRQETARQDLIAAIGVGTSYEEAIALKQDIIGQATLRIESLTKEAKDLEAKQAADLVLIRDKMATLNTGVGGLKAEAEKHTPNIAASAANTGTTATNTGPSGAITLATNGVRASLTGGSPTMDLLQVLQRIDSNTRPTGGGVASGVTLQFAEGAIVVEGSDGRRAAQDLVDELLTTIEREAQDGRLAKILVQRAAR